MAAVPGHQIAVPRNAVFQLEQINTSLGAVSDDGSGQAVIYDPRGQTSILHWADLEMAEGWRTWLRQIVEGLSDDMAAKLPTGNFPAAPATIAFIRRYAGKSDAELLRTNTVRVWLSNALGAIANYYNAENVPWSSDPSARRLYRKYFAGAPRNYNPQNPAASDEFSRTTDYNSQWYAPNKGDYPVINRSGAFGQESAFPGLLPKALIAAFNSKNPTAADTHPIEYRRTAGLQLIQAPDDEHSQHGWPLSSGDSENDPVFAPAIANWAFIDMLPSADGIGSFPYRAATIQIETAQFAPWWVLPPSTNFDCAPDASARRAAGLDPNTCDGGQFGAYTLEYAQAIQSSYAWAVPGVVADTQLAGSSPLVQYLAWVREWAQTILDRDPRQVIVETRKYVVWVNSVWANAYGGNGAELYAAAGQSLEQALAEQHTLDPTITAVAASVTAVGAALASSTYGISAVVGAVVGGGLMLYNAMIKHGTSGLYKDDLGQWKPTFLRGWLGGRIAGIASDLNLEPTYIPVEVPYGFVRGEAPMHHGAVGAPPALRVTNPYVARALANQARANAQQQASNPAFQQGVLAGFQSLTPDQITRVIGQNGELCSSWSALSIDQKRAQLTGIGYAGDPTSAIAMLDSRCSQIATETQSLVTQPSTRSKVLPWVIGGVVLAAGGTALYFALRKKPPHAHA